MPIKDSINTTRYGLKRTQLDCYCIHEQINSLPDAKGVDKAEAHANVTLAYRHVEDARMRLGKVIEALEGGVSCYDKPAAVVEPSRHEGEPASSPF